MDETKRVPSEAEARLLLRAVAHKMEDDAAIGDYASAGRRGYGPQVAAIVVVAVCFFGLVLLDRSMRSWAGLAGACAWLMVVALAGEFRRLAKVTKALARTVERMRAAEPLPRAPAPPAPTAG